MINLKMYSDQSVIFCTSNEEAEAKFQGPDGVIVTLW